MNANLLGQVAEAKTLRFELLRSGRTARMRNRCAMGRHILGDGRILAGIGLVENDHHELCEISAAPALGVEALDRRLLLRARTLHAKLPFSSLDLLMVDEIGKNISGAGMDTKVIGRRVHHENRLRDISYNINIRRIYIRDIAPESAGNAMGMGLADVMHGRIKLESGALFPPEMVANPLLTPS